MASTDAQLATKLRRQAKQFSHAHFANLIAHEFNAAEQLISGQRSFSRDIRLKLSQMFHDLDWLDLTL